MGYLLPALTPERFETQRDVVLNERRQNYENRPYGLALMAITAALFPPEHPYHWMTIGQRRRHSRDAARGRAGVLPHLLPPGECVADAGRRHRSGAGLRSRGSATSASCAPGVQPAPLRRRRRCSSAKSRLVLEDRVELPRVYMAWHSPAMFAEGDAEMDLLGDLLANGKTSRLYRTLVYEQRVGARRVRVSELPRARRVSSCVVATAAPGRSLDGDRGGRSTSSCSAVIDEGPTDAEMERARAQVEAHFMYRLQTVGGFGGKSDQLNAYNVFRGDPGFFAARPGALPSSHRRSRVAAAAARIFDFDRRVAPQRRPAGPGVARALRLRAGRGFVMRVGSLAAAGRRAGSGRSAFPGIVRHRAGQRTATCGPSSITRCRSSTFVAADRGRRRRRSVGARRARRYDGRHGRRGHGRAQRDRCVRGVGGDRRRVRRRGRRGRHDVHPDHARAVRGARRGAPGRYPRCAQACARPTSIACGSLRLDRLRQLKDLPPAVAERAFLRLMYGDHPYGHLAIGTESALRALALERRRRISCADVPAGARHARHRGSDDA